MFTKYVSEKSRIMFLNQLRYIPSYTKLRLSLNQNRFYTPTTVCYQTAKPLEIETEAPKQIDNVEITRTHERLPSEIYPTARVVPMVLTNKEPVVLSFDDVPGPKSLKYLSTLRHYLSEVGTQLTVGVLTVGLNVGSYISNRKSLKSLSVLFDEYGSIVRFVSPIGGDIVLINNPDHIQKVYAMEGESPVRSALDSLEKYRAEHRSHVYAGLFSIHGQDWTHQREVVYAPLHNSVAQHVQGICDTCDNFAHKLYNIRNYQDEVTKDLYKELHKWAFDCMGLIIFSKQFSMLDTELVNSQCDRSWLYHSLEKATDAILKCESGLQLWKLFPTLAWNSLVKHCDSLDSLIGKHVLETEQHLADKDPRTSCLIRSMLLSDHKMSPEDISTILMDMLLIGVNTITSAMSFMLYFLAKHQRVQKQVHQEIQNLIIGDITKIKDDTPYLQACLKETLRLVPPIPVLTRILPKNITLDRYNIPRGTLIIMSTQDSSLKESNYEDASRFYPERWLKEDSKDYHPFASIPFGYGERKCLGQNIAETMMSLLTVRVLQKYRLEYHYGDIQPTRSFISRPDRQLKIRFIDRI